MSLAPEKMEETRGRIFNQNNNHNLIVTSVFLQGDQTFDNLYLDKQYATEEFIVVPRHSHIKLQALTGGHYMFLVDIRCHYICNTSNFTVEYSHDRWTISGSELHISGQRIWDVKPNEEFNLQMTTPYSFTFDFIVIKLLA